MLPPDLLNPYEEPAADAPDWVEQEIEPIGDIGPPIAYEHYVTLCSILGTTPVPLDIYLADQAEDVVMMSEFYDPSQPRDAGGRWSDTGGGGGGVAEAPRIMDAATHSMAKKIAERAKLLEPELTRNIKELAAKYDAEIVKMEFNRKDEDSLARKIGTLRAEKGWTAEQAASDGIHDANRYTMAFSPETMTAKASAIIDDLAARGWTRYDHKLKNYFQAGNDYKGLNMNFVNAHGDRFELQLHTFASSAAVETTHKQYEAARVMAAGPTRTALIRWMAKVRNAPGITPLHAELLPGWPAYSGQPAP